MNKLLATLTLLPLTLSAQEVSKLDKIVTPIHPAFELSEQLQVRAMADNEPHICDTPEYENYAKCKITNPANNFHWVSDSDYKDNVVQVVYGPSTCGGLLIDGDLVLTARHCTPEWNEGGAWAWGNEVKIYQSTIYQDPDGLVYEGVADVVYGDTTQRAEDAIDYLSENWAPTVNSVSEEFESRSPNNLGDSGLIADVYSSLRSSSASNINDMAIIKLTSPVKHSSSSALIIQDNLDKNLTATAETYANLVMQPKDTTYNYQGWGLNAYGVTPEKMKSWELKHSESLINYSWKTIDILGKNALVQFFANSSMEFMETCDSESLINSGDSGTPLFDSNENVVGFASRISGGVGCFKTEWSANLKNNEFYKTEINRLITPSELSKTIYTDNGTATWSFDIQNLSSETKAVIPSIDGNFSISHNCSQTLAPLEHCRMDVAFNGSLSDAEQHLSTLTINTDKSIPVNLLVTGTKQPVTPTEPEPTLPTEIVIDIDSIESTTIYEKTIDISFLSKLDDEFVDDLTFEWADDEQMDHWAYGTIVKAVDLSEDSAVGQYREIPSAWVVKFNTRRDETDYPNLWAEAGVYKGKLISGTATINVTVNYLTSGTPTDPTDPVTPTDPTDPVTPTPPSSGGSSGGSVNWLVILGLFITTRMRLKK